MTEATVNTGTEQPETPVQPEAKKKEHRVGQYPFPISIRLNLDDKIKLDEAVKLTGKSGTELIRAMVHDMKIYPRPAVADIQMLSHFSALGNNLNQAVGNLNALKKYGEHPSHQNIVDLIKIIGDLTSKMAELEAKLVGNL